MTHTSKAAKWFAVAACSITAVCMMILGLLLVGFSPLAPVTQAQAVYLVCAGIALMMGACGIVVKIAALIY